MFKNIDELFHLAFQSDNPGYRPHVVESPNGDGVRDEGKRYAHVAPKYFPQHPALVEAYNTVFFEAMQLAAGTPLPGIDYASCCLRFLEYPPGHGSAEHTDFNLFTVNVWRYPKEGMLAGQFSGARVHWGELSPMYGWADATPHSVQAMDIPQRAIVFFALPSLTLDLVGWDNVGSWLNARVARSRY